MTKDLNGVLFAWIQGVSTREKRDLELDLEPVAGGIRKGPPSGSRVIVRFSEITNFPNVRRFFFGYRAREHLHGIDQVIDVKQTRVGWSLELADRGRVSIKTNAVPSLNHHAG